MSLDLFAPSAPALRVARVALPLPIDRLFDYAIPAPLAPEVEVGRRVRVRAQRRSLVGVIVAVIDAAEAPEDAPRALRPLDQVLDPAPAIAPALVEILRDEADAVLCPLGLALAAALPPGSSPRPAPVFALAPRGREALRAGAARGEVQRLLERLQKGPRGAAALRRAGFAAAALAALVDQGLVERVAREPRRRGRR